MAVHGSLLCVSSKITRQKPESGEKIFCPGPLFLAKAFYVKSSYRPKIQRRKGMLSHIPIDLSKVNKADLNKEILRAAIIAELDAVNLYEQMAHLTDDPHIRMILLDVAKEEKTHIGEFQALLLRLDEEQVKEMEHGMEEVEELIGKK
jgi:hypothetical protein